MSTRLIKQIIYGLGLLVVLILLGWGIVALVTPAPPPPAPTPTPGPQVEPIQLEQVDAIQHPPASVGGSSTVDLVARLRNPNPRAGVPEYNVTFILFDTAGAELSRQTASTYILPGSLQYASKLNVTVSRPVGRVEVALPQDPVFSTVPASVSLPRFSTFLRERATRNIGENVVEEQKGVITNTSNLDWQFVEVSGVALNAAGAAGETVGVGQTFVGELKIGEQREFTLQWPLPADPASRVIILPTTNIYRQENVIRAIGDPGLLR